jgi:DNA recombination protein RmuC
MNNQTLIIVITFVVLIAFSIGIIVYIINRKISDLKEAQKSDPMLQLFNQNLHAMQTRMDESNRLINDQLSRYASLMTGVGERLGQMTQIGTQLQEFQAFLRSPKLRGNLGEQGLKNLLSQILPKELYKEQYHFKNGEIVDFIIKIDSGIIPIDAKFPLENFNRLISTHDEQTKLEYYRAFKNDFKKHVQKISQKYILPDEKTTDFAFMYIPSESIFFEVLNNEKLNELYHLASRSKIILASPSTFFYYLRTIMLGLEGRRVEELSRQILATLRIIQQESTKMGASLGVLNKHINNAKNTMDTVNNDYMRLSNKIDNVRSLENTRDDQEKLFIEESRK